jgi:GTP pyrophosphokinase
MNWETLHNQLPKIYSQQDVELVCSAYKAADKAHKNVLRKSGEPYIVHPLAVAGILAELRLDARTVAAALLHDVVEDTPITIAELTTQFGSEVADMVDGVTKLEDISGIAALPADSRDPRIESLRKMLFAMVKDVRVVLIKLADRLHNMRTLSSMPADKQLRISRETLDIYAPLASVLGIYQIKWELEDLAFRYLMPETYFKMAQALNERREEREAYVQSVVTTLENELAKHGVQAKITGRPKHIYSIYRKMNRKGVDMEQVYDQQGVRVMVPEIGDCYNALGVVHTMWRPIKGEFDDYIATPKDNQYQSLHTAVYGPGGKPLEVQIRTHEMDRIADVGIAAHWRYKSQTRRDEVYETKVAWLRSVLDWQSQEQTGGPDFLATVKEDLFKDRVYVFTPKGEVIDLPAGSTPVDFAYQVHTEVGHRCRGAKVRGKLVNLDYQLQSGDQVEILTVKRGGPSRDWLNPHLGYVKTSRARSKIRQWFRQQNRDENINAGRQILEKELNRLGIDNLTYQDIASLFGADPVDDFLEKVGYGDTTPVEIAEKVLELNKIEEPLKEAAEELPSQESPQKPAIAAGDGVSVMGAGNMLTYLARCCNPLPPDAITGFVTRGRGVAVHRRECPNVMRLAPERLISVGWGATPPKVSRVKIRVLAFDRAGLLSDITGIFKEESINLEGASAVTGRQDNLALITATLEVKDAEQLSRVLTRIERLPNVREVRRQAG